MAANRASGAVEQTVPPAIRAGGKLPPPWSRAPGLGFRSPAVFVAVVVAAAILAGASGSSVLFLSSSSSAALQSLVAARCPDAAKPTVQVGQSGIIPLKNGGYGYPRGLLSAASFARMNQSARSAFTRAGLPAPALRLRSLSWYQRRRIIPSAAVQLEATGSRAAKQADVSLLYQAGALAHVHKLASAGGRGAWIPDTLAAKVGAKPGRRVRVDGVPVRVAGVYHDMGVEPVRRFWCSETILFKNPSAGNDLYPAKLMIFTDPAVFAAVDHRVGDDASFQWIAPVDTSHLSLSRARTLIGEQAQAQAVIAAAVRRLHVAEVSTSDAGSIHDMADRAALIRDGVRGPVVSVAIGGSVLALLLVAAAGLYWVERRFREVRLLASRGVGAAALAGKAALELAAPVLIGTAVGWGLAIGLVRLLGPSSTLDAAAPWQAAGIAAVGFVAGLLLLTATAGVRARNTVEARVGRRLRIAAALPWELVVLAAALGMYLRLRHEAGVTLVAGVGQVNLLVVAFALVFLLGGIILLTRLLALGLPLLRRSSQRWPVAAYLAVRRITGAPTASVTLAAAAALPMAMLVYSAGITGTTEHTTVAKTHVYAGAPVTVSTTTPIPPSPALHRIGTAVVRIDFGTLGTQGVEVLGIDDPAAFARTAYWDGRFAGGRSLPSLLAELDKPAAGGRLPAIVWRYGDNTSTDLRLGNLHRQIDVRSSVRAFPGLRNNYRDLVVVDTAAVGNFAPKLTNTPVNYLYEVWTRHRAAAAEKVIAAQHGYPLFTITPTTVIHTTNYSGITWSFTYLQALAALIGVIALGGLLQYLAARQRARNASYLLARRMGLSSGNDLRSLLLELLALLAIAWAVAVSIAACAITLVYQRLDPDTTHPPTPLLTLPATAAIVAAGAALLVAIVCALVANHISARANPREVLAADF